jgi:hypothetical protein
MRGGRSIHVSIAKVLSAKSAGEVQIAGGAKKIWHEKKDPTAFVTFFDIPFLQGSDCLRNQIELLFLS